MILHYFVEGENQRKLIETIKNRLLKFKGEITLVIYFFNVCE